MKYLIGVFLMIILSSICNAEIIDGPANIRTQPEGEILFSIEDGAYTNVVRLENDWYMINICAWVEIVNIENNKLIIGSFLTTITNRKVCSIINPTEIDRILNVSENKARVQISGYTFKSNLRENEICNNVEIDTNSLKPLIQYYLENEFEKHRECGFRFVSYNLIDIIPETTDLNIYLWVHIAHYKIIQNDSLYVNGGGSVAVRLKAVKHKGSYLITDFEEPHSGEGYGESLAILFPKSVRGKMKSVNLRQLGKETRQKAKNYYERMLGKSLR